MKKIVLLVIGSLAAIYCAAGVVQMLFKFSSNDPTNAYSVAEMAASVVPPVIGLLIAVLCFQNALAKPKSGQEPKDDERN
jgi:hypothetical protein